MRVFPVPVAPAISPCRFEVASGSRTTASRWSPPSCTPRPRSMLAPSNAYASAIVSASAVTTRTIGPWRSKPPEAGRPQAARRLPDLRADDPRQAARVPRLRGHARRSRGRCSTRCTTFYETSYGNVHRGVYTLSERADRGVRGRPRQGRGVRQRALRARGRSSRGARPRRSTSSRTPGATTTSGPATSSSVTELEHHSNFVPWQYIAKRTGASFRTIPIDDAGELVLDALDEIAASGQLKVVANNLVSNALGTINPIDRLDGVGARARRDHGRRRRAGRAAPARSTCRRSTATSSRSPRTRCAGRAGVGALWGRRELLERDGAVQPRRPDDPQGRARADDVERAAVQVRGGHAGDRRGGRLRRRGRLPDRDRARRDRGARARARGVRAGAARRDRGHQRSTGRPPSAAPGSSRSTSRASTRTTSRRCSTGRASPSAPATTARSR